MYQHVDRREEEMSKTLPPPPSTLLPQIVDDDTFFDDDDFINKRTEKDTTGSFKVKKSTIPRPVAKEPNKKNKNKF